MKTTADELGEYVQEFSPFYISPQTSPVLSQDSIVSQRNDPIWCCEDCHRDWRLRYHRTECVFLFPALRPGANQLRNLTNYNQNVGNDAAGIIERLVNKVKVCGFIFPVAVNGSA